MRPLCRCNARMVTLCSGVLALPRLILGIESSCDDTGVGIVSPDGRILGASLAGQAAIHAAWGGVVPNLAQEAHAAAMEGCIAEALDQAGVRPQDLAAVAVTVGPGLSLCLKVGVRAARQLAATHGLPLIPVHHMEAHALMARMGSGVRFPYLCALVSGGHNLLTLVHGVGRYTLLGTSLDDAAGEAYDKANCNFSFAGLKTAVRVAAGRHLPAEGQPLRGKVQDDLAAGFQRAAVRHLADRTARAAQWAAASDPGVRHLVVSGGVAANAAVRAALSDVAARAGLELRDWEDVKPRWPLTGERHPNMAAEAARSAKKQRIFPSLTQLVAEQAAMEAAQTP
ncbi:putative tRNA N6-adenosine threonylcarbamoyltransferase, mitochondrial [Auxenochlorella protothecoides]|uniref:N(6)-L-threonylcarbamoyladenine synthase n=1 Tax=Auxenochlorella protothecoides TaxID=3075 RepID=A0A087SR83_AUXPR|nr:putative tRNA N6-adenosine threonylcarbamoyltransferase, mitochondrial [Auxenochlorella protothecoides]KFM28237.1 putative tRNA N6-adenosine threonylcarbamoyltransferase, mitochondrial [Auxenochlorella protothecoides]